MARRARVSYWASRKAYGCWIDGRQHILSQGPDDAPHGPTYNSAVRRYADLVMLGTADTAKDRNPVQVVCERYLRWVEKHRGPGTFKVRRDFLQPFIDRIGDVPVGVLTHQRIDECLDDLRAWRKHSQNGAQVRWGDSSVLNGLASLSAAFNWAMKKEKIITSNPLTGFERPKGRSRGRRSLTGRTPKERAANHRQILAAASPAFRPFVICLEATGARPGELANATAADFDAKLGAIVYHADDNRLDGEFRHKTAGRGKDRVIFLSGEALEIVRETAVKRPKGPLFRTRDGHGWTGRTVVKQFLGIRGKVELPHLTAYSYRHTFATAWLEQGKSIEILAELLGNTPETIRKHYSHLCADAAHLRRQLEAFRNASAVGFESPSPAPSASA